MTDHGLVYNSLTDTWYDPDSTADPWADTAWIGLPKPPIPHIRSPQKVGEVENLWTMQDGFVYVLASPDWSSAGFARYYKIGRAKNLEKRVGWIRLQLPWPVSWCTRYAARAIGTPSTGCTGGSKTSV